MFINFILFAALIVTDLFLKMSEIFGDFFIGYILQYNIIVLVFKLNEVNI
jgi:hypothetical protein